MYNTNALEDKLKEQLKGNQLDIATKPPEKTKYRRVKGTAGSGKSLALAARAAKLASEGKRVLVCSYNISLLGYLKDLVKQFIGHLPPQITFTHFHGWCRTVCEETSSMDAYRRVLNYPKEDRLKDHMAELVSQLYESKTPNLPTYDAILLDEGHDQQVHWWTTLRKAIVQGGEALFVCDKTQDLYETAKAWTDETMEGLDCGFTGRWMELRESHRLTGGIIPILEDFTKEYLIPYGGEVNIPPQDSTQINLLDKFRWVQVPQGTSAVDACIKEINRLYNEPDIPWVAFLSGTEIGKNVVREFKKRDMDIFHTHYDNWKMARKAKLALHPGCAEIVATTVHSFKGWESSHIVAHVDKIESLTDRAVFYTALSRLKKHSDGVVLTVVSSCTELEDFGRKHFPDFDPPNLEISDFDIKVNTIPF